MPLTINMWKHTTKGLAENIEHPKLGPFFAGLGKGNVGHMNVIFETYDQNLKKKHPTLPFKPARSYETVKVGEKEGVGKYKRGALIKMEKVENSYWPQVKPGIFKHIQSFFDPEKGATGEFRQHLSDMIDEEEDEVHTIIHDYESESYKGDKDRIQALKNLILTVKNDIFSLEKDIKGIKERIDQLELEKKSLKGQQKRINEIDKRIKAYEIDLAEAKKLLDQKNETINKTQNRLNLLEFEIVQRFETKGKHPDFSVTLPTKESGKKFFLEEEAMLAEMEKQRINPKFALFGNNCAASVKKVLVAGIKHREEEMIAAGVPKKFFKVKKIEAPGDVLKWALKLNNYLEDLNMKYAKGTAPKKKP